MPAALPPYRLPPSTERRSRFLLFIIIIVKMLLMERYTRWEHAGC